MTLWNGRTIAVNRRAAGREAADIGVLIERADRWARAAERDALAAMIEGGVPAGKSAARMVFGQADYAVDAAARLEQVLNRLRKRMPEAAGAELEVAQSAFRDDFRRARQPFAARHRHNPVSACITSTRPGDTRVTVDSARPGPVADDRAVFEQIYRRHAARVLLRAMFNETGKVRHEA